MTASLGAPMSTHIQSQICNSSISNNNDPTSSDSMHEVVGDERHAANVSQKRSTECMAASIVAPMSTNIPPLTCIISTHHFKLRRRWQPPSHFSQSIWKPMPIEYIPPWHIIKSNKPSSKHIAHKASSLLNSNRKKLSDKMHISDHITKAGNKRSNLFLYFYQTTLLIHHGITK